MRTRHIAFATGTCLFAGLVMRDARAQTKPPEDRRVEQPKGYHVISRPARSGETPPEVKQEKAEEDNNKRRRNDFGITDQTAPTRQPELKPKDIKP